MKYRVICLLALGAGPASAATVTVASTITSEGNIHGTPGNQVALKNHAGDILPVGMRLRVGFFLNYTAELDQTLRTPAGVFSLMDSGSPNRFIPLGEPPVQVGYGQDVSPTNVTKLVAGRIRWNTTFPNITYTGGANDPYDDNTLAAGGPTRGTRLFLLAYNSPDLYAEPWGNPGFEYGIFSDPSWRIPETGTATMTLNVALIDNFSEVFWGSIGNSLHTAPVALVPEPSAASLSFAALLGLIRRFRRFSKRA